MITGGNEGEKYSIAKTHASWGKKLQCFETDSLQRLTSRERTDYSLAALAKGRQTGREWSAFGDRRTFPMAGRNLFFKG